MSPWEDRAACRNERDDLFFPPGNSTLKNLRQAQEAIAICNDPCPVRRQCLETALSIPNVSGIWGGIYLSSGSDQPNHNKRKIRSTLETL